MRAKTVFRLDEQSTRTNFVPPPTSRVNNNNNNNNNIACIYWHGTRRKTRVARHCSVHAHSPVDRTLYLFLLAERNASGDVVSLEPTTALFNRFFFSYVAYPSRWHIHVKRLKRRIRCRTSPPAYKR